MVIAFAPFLRSTTLFIYNDDNKITVDSTVWSSEWDSLEKFFFQVSNEDYCPGFRTTSTRWAHHTIDYYFRFRPCTMLCTDLLCNKLDWPMVHPHHLTYKLTIYHICWMSWQPKRLLHTIHHLELRIYEILASLLLESISWWDQVVFCSLHPK